MPETMTSGERSLAGKRVAVGNQRPAVPVKIGDRVEIGVVREAGCCCYELARSSIAMRYRGPCAIGRYVNPTPRPDGAAQSPSSPANTAKCVSHMPERSDPAAGRSRIHLAGRTRRGSREPPEVRTPPVTADRVGVLWRTDGSVGLHASGIAGWEAPRGMSKRPLVPIDRGRQAED